ncbi:MAG: hypothetical protein EOM23_01250 [Candidatus Moranbacteria bacterium]|nr:hypothetical protein [Candidatus Moranbacteria bacterium]
MADLDKKRDFELGQIFDAAKIVNSMAFKTGTAIAQLFVIFIFSIVFAQFSVGLGDWTAITESAFWGQSIILFGEQYYAYFVMYDWIYTAFLRGDTHLVGNGSKESPGLISEYEDTLKIFETNLEKIEIGLTEWNRIDKIEVYRNSIKDHITKLQDQIRKQRFAKKKDEVKITELKERVETAIQLLNDKETIDNIEFLNIKGFRPVYYKDLVNGEKVASDSKTRNSLVDINKLRRGRFKKKLIVSLFTAAFGGLLIWDAIAGGSGFWGRFLYMIFVIMIQVAWAIKDAYTDVYRGVIPNYKLKKRILLFCSEFTPKPKPVEVKAEVKEDETCILPRLALRRDSA